MISSEKPLHTGHLRSPNSISFTFAGGSRRPMPFGELPWSWRLPSATSWRLVSPPLLWLALRTIMTRTAATTRKAAALPIWSSRLRRPSRPPSLSACSRSSRRASRELLPLIRPADVTDHANCVQAEEDRHQDGARHAPLADRFDLEQLQVGEVDAVTESDQGKAEAAHPRRIAAQQRRNQQQHIAGDAEGRDVDPEQMGVGAVGDGLTAAAAGEADRRPAPGDGDRDERSDADAEGRSERR